MIFSFLPAELKSWSESCHHLALQPENLIPQKSEKCIPMAPTLKSGYTLCYVTPTCTHPWYSLTSFKLMSQDIDTGQVEQEEALKGDQSAIMSINWSSSRLLAHLCFSLMVWDVLMILSKPGPFIFKEVLLDHLHQQCLNQCLYSQVTVLCHIFSDLPRGSPAPQGAKVETGGCERVYPNPLEIAVMIGG